MSLPDEATDGRRAVHWPFSTTRNQVYVDLNPRGGAKNPPRPSRPTTRENEHVLDQGRKAGPFTKSVAARQGRNFLPERALFTPIQRTCHGGHFVRPRQVGVGRTTPDGAGSGDRRASTVDGRGGRADGHSGPQRTTAWKETWPSTPGGTGAASTHFSSVEPALFSLTLKAVPRGPWAVPLT